MIYASGDTAIMADMDWIADYYKPTVGILRFDFDIGVQGRTSSFVSYNTSRVFIPPALTFPVGENARLRTNLFYNAREMQERTGVNPGVVVAREIAFGKRTDVGLGLRYTYDSRLTGLNPNAGVLV